MAIKSAYDRPGLSHGNAKLGSGVWVWNLTAILTCCGASAVCKELCYALDNAYRMKKVQRRLAVNYELSLTDDFVPWMIDQIRKNRVRVLRIHSSGDFYDLRYIKKWLQIVKACPDTMFYGYTRSWVVPELTDALLELGREPNVNLYWSFDKSMPQPPVGPLTCYLMIDDEDQPPCHATFAFRHAPTTTMTVAAHDTPVCRYEADPSKSVKCAQCRRCWTK
jgi:hypothetical protein